MAKDILIYATGNGGDIAVLNNDIALGDTILQQAYLAMFGGNIEASTKGNEVAGELRLDWWGNSLFFAGSTAKQFNSATAIALQNNVLTSTGRVNILRAAESDLKYLKAYADVAVNVAIQSNSRVNISVQISEPGGNNSKQLSVIWDAVQNEVITAHNI